MRKVLLICLALVSCTAAFSQTTKDKKKFNIGNRAGDHLMLQISSDNWIGTADSVKSNMKGFSRGLNLYFMLDRPFKGNPRISAALGLGVSTSHMFFERMAVDIAANTQTLPFYNLDTLNHYKKYKLSTAYLELPVELRFTSRPDLPNKSFKAAIGIKAGTMLSAHTKGKIFRDKNGNVINDAIQKTSSKRFFTNTRLTATARVGMGNFTLFGAYSFTNIFKDQVAPETRLLQVGITFSGL
ncbi:MAG TPA: outer membrane beta-barrel protein [Ferruginibacter sp.]|nr:outer membrane beta-barrel protein [Ferruginibacter sp.]